MEKREIKTLDEAVDILSNKIDLVVDEKLKVFKKEFKAEINNDFKYHIDVLLEGMRHETVQLIESMNMRFESVERFMEGYEIDRMKLDGRVSRLEAKVF